MAEQKAGSLYIAGWYEALLAIEDLVYAEKLTFEEAMRRCYAHVLKLYDWKEQGETEPIPWMERQRLAVVEAGEMGDEDES